MLKNIEHLICSCPWTITRHNMAQSGTTRQCPRISFSPASSQLSFATTGELKSPYLWISCRPQTSPITAPHEFPPSHWDVFHQNTQLAISTDDACTIHHSPWLGFRIFRTNHFMLHPCLPNVCFGPFYLHHKVLVRSGIFPNNPQGLATFQWLRWRGSSSVLS